VKELQAVLNASQGLPQKKYISWSVYHSNQDGNEDKNPEPAISSLLPLFPDQAKSAAMTCHSLNMIKACVHHLNYGQIPVVAIDQPLYAVAKQLQWNFPEKYGERQFVIMFGRLHIEMAFLKAIGGWLEGSGWTVALTEANVASAGTADSFLKATSVTRTRRAHQITASTLYVLLTKSYTSYKESLGPDADVVSFSSTFGTSHFNWNRCYWRLQGLSERPILNSTLTYFRGWFHGSFRWTIQIMLDGYQFTYEICIV